VSEPVAGAPGVKQRADLLAEVLELTRGRVDPELTREAEVWLEGSAGRLTLGSDHTVVALAGATGSGKSSLYNRLAGLDLAAVGVRRPTTSWALACVWGNRSADDLLTWLDIPPRHRVMRGGSLAGLPTDDELDGLILLDLPDHDSTEIAHHLEMSRLVGAADVIVWVVDPQKYADTALHDGYLRPLADHQELMLVCLNHIDEVHDDRREALIADLRRLLAEDGMPDVPVLATSATRGDGVKEARAIVVERVQAKRAAADKVNADIRSLALRIQEQNGATSPGDIARASSDRLAGALEEAAGVEVLVRAVRLSRRHHTGRRVGWPVVSWLARFFPDPNARAGAGTRREPRPVPVERARVDAAVRRAADEIGARLPAPWTREVKRIAEDAMPRVSDDLDKALAAQHLDTTRVGWGWRLVQGVQIGLLVGLLAGVAWWVADAAGRVSATSFRGFPYGAWMAAATGAAGLLLALGMTAFVRVRATRFAEACGRAFADSVQAVADARVIGPIDELVATYRRSRELLLTILGKA
jgi:GTPase Era involved in 16S rRNA processing